MKLLAPVLILLSIFSPPAFAYLDPVTGSFLLQGIIAGFAASMVFFRSLREKILSFFSPSYRAKKEAAEREAEESIDEE